MHLSDGTTLQGGKYVIRRFISSGGFGCTYEGTHQLLKSRVAIKEFFVSDFCDRDNDDRSVKISARSKEEIVERLRQKFIDEARALFQMHHKGIVHVYDVFEENGTAYYVMDYIDGMSLEDVVKHSGSLSEEKAKKYILQVAEALDYVHSHNRLHLDLKPANIMIDKSGNAVLIDFGVSKQYDEAGGLNTSTLLGMTPGYAALEQMGNNVSLFYPATDIYSLAATFYTLLSGKVPVPASDVASGANPVKLPETISQCTRNAIEAAMKPNRKERPQSVAEFVTMLGGEQSGNKNDDKQLQGVETEYSSAMRHTDTSRKPWVKYAVLVGLVVIGCVVGLMLLRTSTSTVEPVSSANETTSKKVSEQIISVTEDGNFIYTGEVDENGLPSGEGRGEYGYGVYEGHYENGRPNGKGVFHTSDGKNSYEGNFKDFEYTEGTLRYLQYGAYFQGTFKEDVPNNGSLYDKDGKEISKYVEGVEIKQN